MERYSRQTVFKEIGEEGQKKLLKARVAVIGIGALGTVIANNLARSGVGFIRLVDRDFIDITNLQRQTLFTEEDVKGNLPKAVAAARHLQEANSEIALEPVCADVNARTAAGLIQDTDLVLDGTDNMETRFLINEACCKLGIPWIYGGALASYGATMNIIPGKTPCFQCLYPDIPTSGALETCASAGVLNMITGIIGCIESAEALKILTGNPHINTKLRYFDVWDYSFSGIELKRDPECPVCGKGRYNRLERNEGSNTSVLCGRGSVQVVPAGPAHMDFGALAARLEKLGRVRYNEYLLKFEKDELEITLFADGRAIIKNAVDENAAKSIYSEYIGL